ncbi:hypothetical protein K8R43_04880 [archaeon]|nr:hypothetical protein [archaeon]
MVKRLIARTSPRLLKVAIGLILLSFVLVLVFVLTMSDTQPILPNVTVNNSAHPNGSNGSVLPFTPENNVTENGSGDPYAGMWICGNGIADPREDCVSCPQDLPMECACMNPSGVGKASLGENFSVCFNQEVTVDGINFKLSDYVKMRMDVAFPNNRTDVLNLKEGEVFDIWYWSGANLNSYELSVLKKVYHGVWLKLDYPELEVEEKFSVLSGQTVKIGDYLFSASFSEGGSEGAVEVLVNHFGVEETKVLNPGENITLNDWVLVFNSTVDGALCFSFVGDSDD